MVRKTVDAPDTEPTQFQLPSENVEHFFQVVDILDSPDPDIVITKIEVAEGDETGRSLLHRVNLDEEWKGFFHTRLFLKAIGEPYKGSGIGIDSDNWPGKQFYASVVHTQGKSGKTYANIDQYNFEKLVEQAEIGTMNPEEQQKAWDE